MTQKELYERNAELLRSIIPGVQAKDYKIESLNIFNIALFMVAKGFNEALGFDVLNYEEIFKISNDSGRKKELDDFLNSEMTFFPDGYSLEFQNTEEVTEYCSHIRHYIVEQMYSKWIYDHIKLPNNRPVEAGLGAAVNFNNMNILENICCQEDAEWIKSMFKELDGYKQVAEQLLNDNLSEIKGMWIATVHMVYVAFANLVGFALSGQRITDWDYFWDLCSQLMLGSKQEQLDASAEKAFNPAQSQAPVDKNQPVELVGWSDIKPTSYVAPSEIEEVIIKKIMEEKMREVKISVG